MIHGLPRLVACLALTTAALCTTACASSARAPAEVAQGPVALEPLRVEDADFARSLHQVLAQGERSEARRKLALGVAKRQLVHAGERFRRGADQRAMSSLLGGFYLLRTGELSPRLFDAETGAALDAAIERLSARGDDGRARVLLLARAESLGPEQKATRMQHVAELDRWTEEVRGTKPIERAGEHQRSSLSRSLLDDAAIAETLEHTSRWIDLAIEHNVAFRQTGKRPSPEEQLESVRALETGALSVVALMLRWGDLDGAVRSVDQSSARRTIDPEFYAVLRRAIATDDGDALRALYVALRDQSSGRIGGDLGMDPLLYEAAAFGLLVEAYRRDTSHLETTIELSRALVRLGLCEAVPLVLEGALGAARGPEELGLVLETMARAVDADTAVGDGSAAARTIAASAGLLARAQELSRAAPGGPSVADLRYRMGSAAVRSGKLEVARPLLEQALAEQPSSGGRMVLAMIERQAGRSERALELLAATARDPRADALERAEAELVAYELRRDREEPALADEAALEALAQASRAVRSSPTVVYRLRALRTLGRVLAVMGATELSAEAHDRALDEARAERALLGTTTLHAVASALLRSNPAAAKRALARANGEGAPEEDLVYAALWVGFLEAGTKGRGDETAARVLESAAQGGAWTSRLAAWRLGRLGDEQLRAAANTEALEVEAAFYVAMAKRARGENADAELRAVAASPALDLMEVQLARDLLAPRRVVALPKGYKLP